MIIIFTKEENFRNMEKRILILLILISLVSISQASLSNTNRGRFGRHTSFLQLKEKMSANTVIKARMEKRHIHIFRDHIPLTENNAEPSA